MAAWALGKMSGPPPSVIGHPQLFSALSIVTLPMIVIYVVFNRQIVEGITAGSVK